MCNKIRIYSARIKIDYLKNIYLKCIQYEDVKNKYLFVCRLNYNKCGNIYFLTIFFLLYLRKKLNIEYACQLEKQTSLKLI